MSVKPLNNQVYFSGGPVDGRTVVATEANITSISNAYVGMGVTVLNNGSPKKYTIKKLTILGKPDTKANGGYEEDIDTIGAASKESVNIIADKLNKLPSGMYYGQYSSVENLPAIGTLEQKGYAYVSSVEPNVYYIYLYNGDGEEWQDSGNKFVTTELETNLASKSQTKAPTTKIVAEGIESVDVTAQQSFTNSQKETARTNIGAQENIVAMQNVQPIVAALNNRSADVAPITGSVNALGYKVLNPSLSFAEQVESTQSVYNSNTIFEIRDEFDLNKVVTDVEKECTVSTNISSTSTPNIYYIDNTPIVIENGNGVKLPTECVLLNSAKNKVSYSDTTPIHVTTGTFYVASKTSGTYTIIIYDNVITVPANCTLKFNGGKLSNGTINFNGCYIDSPNVQIFGTDMEFANVNVKNTELVATWFGFTPENTDVTQLNKIIAFGCNVFVPKGEYLLTSSIVKTTGNITNIYGESRATILRSTTCDIFNVKYIRIESFQIKAEGYYGVKVNGSGVKVIDNDIRRCAVGIGNEFTAPNKMENEIANNTIHYCSDSCIKYHGSSPTGGYGYISGLKIHDNYIVKAGTDVDDYTTPGTEGLGYGIYIENIFYGTVEKNVCEYCSHSGVYIKYSAYITVGLFVRGNAFEQNKRAQIVLNISTQYSSIRGLEISDNHSSYPSAKVSNFIKEYNITGTNAYGIFTTKYNNKAFGFDGNNSFGKNINTLYENISKLSDIGGNTLSHDLTANGIEFYKGDILSSLPIMRVEPGVYRIKYTMKRTTTPTGGTDVTSGYLVISAKCGSDTVNMSTALLTTAMGAKDFNAFINVQTAGYLYFNAYIEKGSALPEDMPLFTVSNLLVEKYALSAVTRSSIRGMYSDLKGLSIFDDSLNKVISYDGTKWIDEDGEAAGIRRTGTSTQRPTPTNIGFKYFDTKLGKPIFWNGNAWVDANGDYIFDNSGTLQNRLALTSPIKGQQFKLTREGETDVYLIYGDYGWLNATDRSPWFDDSGKLNAMYDKYNYTLLIEEPSNWQTAYNTYYKIVDGVYTKLSTLETWAVDTFYQLDVNTYKGIQIKLTDTDTELLNKVVKWNGTKYINIIDNVALKVGTPEVTFTTENNTTTAAITSTSSGKIYYTKNGDAPTSSSTKYSSAITLADGDQVKAICIRDHMDNSNIGYVPVAKPVITFNAGILHIECDTPDAKIYYTTDGNPPSTSSTVYDSSASVTIATGITVKTFAVLIGRVNSEIATKKRS